jgi:hypothetical protein
VARVVQSGVSHASGLEKSLPLIVIHTRVYRSAASIRENPSPFLPQAPGILTFETLLFPVLFEHRNQRRWESYCAIPCNGFNLGGHYTATVLVRAVTRVSPAARLVWRAPMRPVQSLY